MVKLPVAGSYVALVGVKLTSGPEAPTLIVIVLAVTAVTGRSEVAAG